MSSVKVGDVAILGLGTVRRPMMKVAAAMTIGYQSFTIFGFLSFVGEHVMPIRFQSSSSCVMVGI